MSLSHLALYVPLCEAEMNSKEKSLNQYNLQLHYEYSSFYPKMSVVSTPHEGNFSFQQMKTIKENENQSKCRELWSVVPNGYIHKITITPKAQRAFQERGWKYCESQSKQEFAASLCLLVMSKATPMKFH